MFHILLTCTGHCEWQWAYHTDCSIYAIYHPKGLHLHLVWPGFRSVTVLALTVMELLSILLAMAPPSRWYSCQRSGSFLQANSFSPLLFFFILLVFIIFSILKEEEVLGFFPLTLFFGRDRWPRYGGVFMPDRCDCVWGCRGVGLLHYDTVTQCTQTVLHDAVLRKMLLVGASSGTFSLFRRIFHSCCDSRVLFGSNRIPFGSSSSAQKDVISDRPFPFSSQSSWKSKKAQK